MPNPTSPNPQRSAARKGLFASYAKELFDRDPNAKPWSQRVAKTAIKVGTFLATEAALNTVLAALAPETFGLDFAADLFLFKPIAKLANLAGDKVDEYYANKDQFRGNSRSAPPPFPTRPPPPRPEVLPPTHRR